MTQLDSTFRIRPLWWALAATFAVSCSSTHVPIGDQAGSGGAGGTSSAGGAGVAGTGAGGTPGAGGSTGAGGAKVDAAASGGATGSGGSSSADAASGGTSGTDAATTTDAGSCSSSYASALVKDCTTASDCVLVQHDDCCGTIVTAIRAGTEASFTTADQNFQSCVPGCHLRGCAHPVTAEDGQTPGATGQAFAAECQNGQCSSVVTTGSNCSIDSQCATGEICVAFVSNLGPTSTTTMSCRGNPCGTAALSCTCAGSVCTGFSAGLCSVASGRLTCNDGKQ